MLQPAHQRQDAKSRDSSGNYTEAKQIEPNYSVQSLQSKDCPNCSLWDSINPKHLTVKDLRTLEGVKAHFLKRVLSVSRKTKNRLVYILSGASSFVTDLKETFNLEPTASYALFLEELEDKLSSVDPEIYNTPAMQNDNWKTANWSTRHVLKRHAVHGYHNLLRKRRQFSRAQRKL